MISINFQLRKRVYPYKYIDEMEKSLIKQHYPKRIIL